MTDLEQQQQERDSFIKNMEVGQKVMRLVKEQASQVPGLEVITQAAQEAMDINAHAMDLARDGDYGDWKAFLEKSAKRIRQLTEIVRSAAGSKND